MIELFLFLFLSLADLWRRDLHSNVSLVPGSGAAGGLGGGLMAFCGAKLGSGFRIISEQMKLAEQLENADLVLTGLCKAVNLNLYSLCVWEFHLLLCFVSPTCIDRVNVLRFLPQFPFFWLERKWLPGWFGTVWFGTVSLRHCVTYSLHRFVTTSRTPASLDHYARHIVVASLTHFTRRFRCRLLMSHMLRVL